MIVTENVSLKTLTTFKIGGAARFLISATPDELPEARQFARDQGLPLIPLGSGSNILAPDGDLQAIFVKIVPDTFTHEERGDTVEVTIGASTLWDDVVSRAVQKEWWGIENLSAIPGTAGAAAVQNIGAYGAALAQSLVSVDAYDLIDGATKKFLNRDIGFGYRTSLFKREPDRYIITSVTLSLSKVPLPNIGYRDLASHFTHSEEDQSIGNIRQAVSKIRAEKFPPLSEYGTAGSFFLNPVVPSDEAKRVAAQFSGMPLFPMPEGGVKIPLAWILDNVLSLKGMRMDGAFLWHAQPLVIATEHSATAASVMALADSVHDAVFKKTGIAITPEVRIFSREEKFSEYKTE